MAVLEAENLSIVFGGLHAVDDVHFSLEKEQIMGLIGPNGAGKTTVFNLLTGVYTPTTGQIKLEGQSILGKKTHQITRMGIARTFQNIRLFKDMTVLDNVRAAMNQKMKYSAAAGILSLPSYWREEAEVEEKAMELLSVFHLEDHASDRAKNLPYGQQRKLEIARALATDPKLLLLDEHTAALDPKTADKVLQLTEEIVARDKLTTLMVTHNMKNAIQYGNRLIMMDAGKVVVDIRGEEKKNLTVRDLLEKFNIENDRMLLSE